MLDLVLKLRLDRAHASQGAPCPLLLLSVFGLFEWKVNGHLTAHYGNDDQGGQGLDGLEILDALGALLLLRGDLCSLR